MESLDIKTITEAGTTGIAVLLILYSGWKDRMYNKTVNNHLHGITGTIASLDKTMQAQTKVLENNGRIMERVERVLDK